MFKFLCLVYNEPVREDNAAIEKNNIKYDVFSSNAEHLLFFILMFSHISLFSMNQLKLSFTEYFTTSVDQELAVSPSGS